jgi:phosphatidylglycerol:prolipoprotein diacylglycerol transferase
MSFHGGFSRRLLAMRTLDPKASNSPGWTSPISSPRSCPLGLAAGRIGNFINGELWGRVADPSLPWAMIFPQAGDLWSHAIPHSFTMSGWKVSPSLLILWLYTRSVRPRRVLRRAYFLIGYGHFRFITEFFREPDAGIFGQSYSISMGQWLSLPMI